MSSGHNIRAIPCADQPQDKHRTYLEVFADSEEDGGAGVVITVAGGRPFSIPPGGSWQPHNVPMTSFQCSGEGTMLIS